MPIINAILAELDQEAKSTVKVLSRVPTEHLTWKPHEKSSSLGRLALHVATIPKMVGEGLRAGTYAVGNPGPPLPGDAAEIVAEFERNQAATREYLTTLSDDELHEPFTLTREGTTIMTIKKLIMIRSILMNHTYHHRGQLSVYLRLLDVPVPAVYGTSADERM